MTIHKRTPGRPTPLPYWWPQDAWSENAEAEALPQSAEVVVIGGGITGLSAALELARGGAAVVVLDAAMAGYGGSTRAAGVIGRSLKKGFSQLITEMGLDRAVAIYREAGEAFNTLLAFIETERIDCGLQHCGRFLAANTPELYEAIARDLEKKSKYLGDEFALVPRERQHQEIGAAVYHGGAVIPDHKTLDPFRLVKGVERSARGAGVHILDRTAATGITGEKGAFTVATARGACRARNVIVATNGYTDRALGWFRRRLVPLDAYMIATEPLPPALVQEILPNRRTFNDYRIDTEYGLLAPDGRSFIFGGLTGRRIGDLDVVAARLRRKMTALFPQLDQAGIARVWTGNCAATFDLFPHIGEQAGIHYAMGYSFGSGLPLGLLFGRKLAARILGRPGAASAFDEREFPTKPFYRGNPWFLPAVMAYYSWRDRAGF